MTIAVWVIGLAVLACSADGASTERKVTFTGAEGAKLAGTLELPDRQGPRPALVLLAGSGPTNRDGNQPPAMMTDLLKQIAQGMADKGVITLRFDKRGMFANARGLPKDNAGYGDFFTWENFVEDAASAVRFLRKQSEVDHTRIGILGHSEGGLLALEAARVLKSEGDPPVVLVLVSTPGRSIDLVIEDQLKRALANQGASPQQTAYFLSENSRITQAILQTGKVPPDVPPGLAALYPAYLGKFLRSELTLNPAKLAADFPGPVLILAGSADTQVSPELDAKSLDAALKGRKRDEHALAIISKASHNLKIVESAEDPGFSGPVAPAAMDQLENWTAEHLRTR